MSKGLLEYLLIEFDEMGFEPTTLCDTKKEINSFRNRLKQVLDYLKAMDNSNPSEALECLEEMAKYRIEYSEYLMPIKDINEYKTIKQALLKAQKQEKALEIIKKKAVNVNTLISSIIGAIEPLEFYNEKVSTNLKLTKQEFELLKEVLRNE